MQSVQTMTRRVLSSVMVGVCSAATLADGPLEWSVAAGGNGHWYAPIPEEMSWEAAQASAVAMGAHLVTLGDGAENAFVQARCLSWNIIHPWIGGLQDVGARNYSEPAGGWRWVTGEPWDFVNWNTNEPNNVGPVNEDRLQMGSDVGTWNDMAAGTLRPSIMEWSADCNGDGTVDYGQILSGELADANVNGVPDCCELGSPCVTSWDPVEWRVSDGGNGHWYQLIWTLGTGPSGVCWADALAHAVQDSANLLSLHSVEEAQFVAASFCPGPSGGGLSGSLGWIGFQGGDVWSSGEPVTYTAWAAGQPNGDGPHATLSCSLDWNDIGGSAGCHISQQLPLAFWVQEWSADCNADGIVDFGQILSGELADENANNVPDCCEGGPACNCLGDVTANKVVDGVDLAAMLGAWGSNGQGQFDCDVNNDGIVDAADLAVLLGDWGSCG